MPIKFESEQTPKGKSSIKFDDSRQDNAQIPESPVGKRAYAFGRGAVTGLVGAPGELEKFGAYTVPKALGFDVQPQSFMGRETIFPTTSEISSGMEKIGIPKPSEEERGYETAGEILGGFAPGIPGLVRGGIKSTLGIPSATSENVAKRAEKLGFKISPTQVRQDSPLPAYGATGSSEANQKLANKLASKATGEESAEINDIFLRKRLSELGKDFDKVYLGKQFKIDLPAIQALDAIRTFETALPASQQLANVRNTADNIVKNFRKMSSRPGASPSTFAIQGDALQTIRNDLMSAARSASDRSDAHRIYELIDNIDASIARNHPNVAAELDRIRPLYRNTVVLEDLYRSGGIKQGNISLERLGNLLGSGKQTVRRKGNELDELANIGRELKLRARWEPVGEEGGFKRDLLRQALGTAMGATATTTGFRSPYARAAQRMVSRRAERLPTIGPRSIGSATGTISGQFDKEE